MVGKQGIEVAAITNPGRLRERNEDALSIHGNVLTGTMREPFASATSAKLLVLLVADGMGGHPRGDVASRTALKTLIDRGSKCITSSGCAEALQAANHRLYDLMEEEPGAVGLGTTVVGAVVSPNGLISFNVGDSRIYRHSQNSLVRLSEDDVPLGTRDFQGPRATHQITQSLGGRLARTAIVPHVKEGPPLAEGESLLLCSDGLTDMLAERDISKVMTNVAEPAVCAARLMESALDAGGHDNVSIIVARAT